MKRTLAALAAIALCLVGMTGAQADPADEVPAGPYTSSALNENALNPTIMDSPVGQPVADVSMVRLDDGTIRAFLFVQTKGLEAADSHDGGKTFARVGSVFGSDNGYGFPRVVKLDDGRLRLYSANGGSIACLISDNGLNFTLEKTTCINNAPYGTSITGPGIVRLKDGTYRAFFSDHVMAGGGPSPHQIFSATSPDGLNWTADPGVRYGPGSNIPRSGEHPAAVLHPDGSVGIFAFDNGAGGGPLALYYARSTDGGLTFGEPSQVPLTNALNNAFGNDPDVILREDGSILLAAGGFTSSIGGYVGTYVLSPASAPSTPTIVATCKAAKRGSAFTLSCTGTTTGLATASMLMPSVRYSTKGAWTNPGGKHPSTTAKGTFAWSFAVPKGKKTVSVYFASGSVKSKPVTVKLT